MVFSGRVHRPKTGPFHSKAGIYATKNAAMELIIYSKSSECALVAGMITYSWKNLLPDLHFFKVGTHIWAGVPCPSLMLQVSNNNDAHGHDEQ